MLLACVSVCLIGPNDPNCALKNEFEETIRWIWASAIEQQRVRLGNNEVTCIERLPLLSEPLHDGSCLGMVLLLNIQDSVKSQRINKHNAH